MVSRILVSLAGILVALSQTDTVLGCSCAYQSPREHFCSSGIAILARVVSRSNPIYPEGYDDFMKDIFKEYEYVLEVEHDYKPGGSLEGSRVTLRARADPGLCGVGYGVGYYYVTTGSSTCSINRLIEAEDPLLRIFEGAAELGLNGDRFECDDRGNPIETARRPQSELLRVLEDSVQQTEQRKEPIERDVPSEKQLQSLFN